MHHTVQSVIHSHLCMQGKSPVMQCHVQPVHQQAMAYIVIALIIFIALVLVVHSCAISAV